MRPGGNERGVIADWLVKVVVGIGLTGVVLFDAGSIVINFFGLDSVASEVAVDVSTQVGAGGLDTQRQIEAAAGQVAEAKGAKLVSAHVDAEGVLHVKVKRVATTIVVGRIGAIKQWARATAEGSSSTN
jgi:hypothetical protein